MIELFPLAGFLIALYFKGIMVATAVLMVLMVLAAMVEYVRHKKIKPMTLMTTLLVLVFGALTLLLQDERFIKMKPTLFYAACASILLVGVACKRAFIKPLLASALQLPEKNWLSLSLRFGLFFIVMAVANELVWRNFSTTIWGLFKFPGSMLLMLFFIASQWPLMKEGAEQKKVSET